VSVEQTRHTWRIAGISLALLILLTLVLYQQTVQYLISLWNQLESGNYAHGYLVLAISVYLVIRNRQQLVTTAPCPNFSGLLAVIAISVLSILAILVDVKMLQAVSILLLLLAIIWTVLGSGVTRVILFPVLFIGFAIPIWFPLPPVLQDLTADAVFWLIRTLEVPAFRQENMIILPAGNMSVEEACSGLRYLLAALTLGTLYAYLNYKTFYARLMVVLFSAAAAVLANIVRVFIVVYLGYTSDMQHPLVNDHLMLGWYIFGVLMAILLFIDARIYRRYQIADNTSDAGQNMAENESFKHVPCANSRLRYLALMLVTAILVSLGPIAVYSTSEQMQDQNDVVEFYLPAGNRGWSGPLASKDDWMPEYHGAVSKKRAYQKGNDQVTLYIGYYPVQKQGEELINVTNRISNNVWRTVYPQAHEKKAGDQQVLEQRLKDSNGKQRLVWYWYRVAGRNTTNKYEAKALQLLGILTGRSQAFVMAIAIDSKDYDDYTRRVLRDFLDIMGESLEEIAIGGIKTLN